MSTTSTLRERFRSGESTPAAEVERAIGALRHAASRGHATIRDGCFERAMREAEAATLRWKAGCPLGPFDGAPTAVKDECDVEGLPTRAGTVYRSALPVARDATAVARLRAAGAVVLGKTVQHELGLGATGISPHETRTPRNPHDPSRVPGGSSSGSAVAVAMGAIPFAVASDGGGSVRIPAALCGVWGLKPTWGRVPNTGDDNLNGTVGHLGPIARSVEDVAEFLAITAGHDGRCPVSEGSPDPDPAAWRRALTRGVRGLKIAVDDSEWADADPTVAFLCDEALRALEREGATRVKVKVPTARHAGGIGFVTMVAEAALGHAEEWERHRDVMSADVRLALSLGRLMSSREYLHMQALRQRLRREMAEALTGAELYATPTTAVAAPPLRPAAEVCGESDQASTNALVRFTFLGNLTGLPAGTAPVGRQGGHAPVGFQLTGRPWDEATVLAAMAAMERSGAARVEQPAVFYP